MLRRCATNLVPISILGNNPHVPTSRYKTNHVVSLSPLVNQQVSYPSLVLSPSKSLIRTSTSISVYALTPVHRRA